MIIIGCGYLGALVARRLQAQGEQVTGVVRSDRRAAELAAAGIEPLQLDLQQDDLAPLVCADAPVFHFAPPPGQGREDPLTARLLASFAANGQPRRLVYVSTTGVYGDCGGAWVDETWPVQPTAERSLRRWDAEQRLRRWHAEGGGELVILRVAGIYGCDRLPLERIRSGQPVISLEEAPWSNRIHVEDLASVCLAAMERAPDGALYNVCDGHPSTMTDYFCRIAEAAGLPQPPQIPLAEAPGRVSPGMLSYLNESRRLSNRRLLSELALTLRYPTLADGLAACFG
ncbi:SDR family oxidoreductase [Thiohalocapsa marina]|uniref:SDR family oxidoreductase n=1 Tax=Thiohalocapsa marina TaxID=424902 RepID=A0A5M8FMQ6_9GAMM|nr:SDR family oxidoreductase [Thiohalocapsa marina]KAA6185270.1 SDR family oxidoreductase [Thiohalocapsa marina]